MTWTIHVPVLSTGHLTETTCNSLSSFTELLSAISECGEIMFIYVPDEEGQDELVIPEDLLTVMHWAKTQGFSWIRFDSCGDDIAALPKYDWSS